MKQTMLNEDGLWASISEATKLVSLTRQAIYNRLKAGKVRDCWRQRFHFVNVTDLRAGHIIEEAQVNEEVSEC
jgi:AMMECR1 domain-containing protein